MCDHRQLAMSGNPGEIEHVHFLSEDIGNLYQNEECSDIIIKVENEQFPAHKVILASRCEYFRLVAIHHCLCAGVLDVIVDLCLTSGSEHL